MNDKDIKKVTTIFMSTLLSAMLLAGCAAGGSGRLPFREKNLLPAVRRPGSFNVLPRLCEDSG